LPRRRQHNRPAIKIDRSTLEQDKFLDLCQRRETRLTVHLEGNVQLIGLVHRHDRKVIEFGGKNPLKPPRLVAKSAVVYIQETPMVLPASAEHQ
jgi:sRNA-binding regulator protein Hfq